MEDEINYLIRMQRNEYNWWPDYVYRHQIDPSKAEHTRYHNIIRSGFSLNQSYTPAIFAFVRRHGTYVASAVYLTPFLISELPADTDLETVHDYVRTELKKLLWVRRRDNRDITDAEINIAIEWLRRVDCAKHQSDVVGRNGGF